MAAHETTRGMTFLDADLRDEAAPRERAEPLDETTFRAFYDRTARMLAVYLRRVTGDAQLADDLLQETYYRFCRAQVVYENESHRRNSLFRIATNLVLDARRASRRAPAFSPHTAEIEEFEGSDRGASLVEGRADLEKAFVHLKPAEREMLWLAYGLGSSHAEIAETIGVKAASVKLMLFRARRKLAAVLTGNKGGVHGA